MQILRKEIMKFLEEQNDEITASEIIEYVIFCQKINDGEQDIHENRVISHGQVKEIVKSWAQ